MVYKNALILGVQFEMDCLNVKFLIISIYPMILESPYEMDFSHLARYISEYDLCAFSIESCSAHVYRIAKILKCEKSIFQGEQFHIQVIK